MQTDCIVSHKRLRLDEISTHLDCSLDALKLNSLRLPNTILLHVDQGTRVAVQTPRGLALNMLRSHPSENTDGAGAGVLC